MANRGLNLLRQTWPALLSAVLFLAMWQKLVEYLSIPPYILPTPSAIVGRIFTDRDPLMSALLVTGMEALSGYVLGCLIGVLLAFFLALFVKAEKFVIPLLVGFNSVPVIAFAPLVLIWLGMGPASKIAMAAVAVTFSVMLNALQGFRATDEAAVNLLRSFGASPLFLCFRLRLPAAMPSIVNGLRVGITRSVLVVIVSEMLGAYKGLGWTIYQSTQQMDFLSVWSVVVVASAASLLLYVLIVSIDRKIVWWR